MMFNYKLHQIIDLNVYKAINKKFINKTVSVCYLKFFLHFSYLSGAVFVWISVVFPYENSTIISILNENLIWKGNPFNFPAEQKHSYKKKTLGMRGPAIRIISIFLPLVELILMLYKRRRWISAEYPDCPDP